MSPRPANCAARAGSFFFSPLRKRTFSSSTHWPGVALASAGSLTRGTSRPSSSPRRAATGLSENCSSYWPSVGRPRCESTITPAPLSRAIPMVGRAARMRLSLVIRPSFMGTLRSSRMTTVLPPQSRSASFLTGIMRLPVVGVIRPAPAPAFHPLRRTALHYFSRSRAFSSTLAVVKPKRSNMTEPGAEAPKLCMPSTAPSRPTYLCQ